MFSVVVLYHKLAIIYNVASNKSINTKLPDQPKVYKNKDLILIILLKETKGVQALREKSFQIHGAKLFSALPKNLQNSKVNNIEDFKSLLDKYLMYKAMEQQDKNSME